MRGRAWFAIAAMRDANGPLKTKIDFKFMGRKTGYERSIFVDWYSKPFDGYQEAENWPNNRASITTWASSSYTCSPSTYGCQCYASGSTPSCSGVFVREVGASDFGGCTSASYGDGPPAQNLSRSGALGFTALGSSALAYLIWFYLLRSRSSAEVTSYVFLVPVFAVLFGALVLGEVLGLVTLAGGALVLLGIYLVNRPRR